MTSLCDIKTSNRFKFKLKYNFLCYVISGLCDSPHKKFKYAHFQNLVYKAAIGFSTSKLRKKFGVCKPSAIYRFFNDYELEKCTIISNTISILILNGHNYDYIKKAVLV